MAQSVDFDLPAHPYREHITIERPLPASAQQEAELILHFQIDRLTYGVKGVGGMWYCLRSYINTGLLSEASFFRLIFAKDHYLRNQYHRIRAFTSESPFTLLPTNLDQPSFRVPVARLLLSEDLFEEDIITTTLPDWQLTILSQARNEWQQVVDDHQLSLTLQPTIAACLSWGARWRSQHAQYLTLWVHRDQVLLVAVAQGNLLLANAFPYRSQADMLYFVQAVRDELPRPGEVIPVMVPSGHLQERQLEEWPAYGLSPSTYPVPGGTAHNPDSLIYLLAMQSTDR